MKSFKFFAVTVSMISAAIAQPALADPVSVDVGVSGALHQISVSSEGPLASYMYATYGFGDETEYYDNVDQDSPAIRLFPGRSMTINIDLVGDDSDTNSFLSDTSNGFCDAPGYYFTGAFNGIYCKIIPVGNLT